jgi:hypothetical protein
MYLGSPPHPVSPPPLVAQSALLEKSVPPPQGLCKDYQTPLETDSRLRRKIPHNR